MDRNKLQEIIDAHGRWLRNEGGERADLCGADLCGASLCSANLRSADLCGANLRGANLRDADLRNADLCDAILYGANLRNADLRGADLCGADLCGADLREKIIQVGPIGSRRDYTVYNVSRDIVQCGCWNDYKGGSLDEFEERVKNKYDASNVYGNEYRRLIDWLKAERAAWVAERSVKENDSI